MPHPFIPTYFASCQPGMLRALIENQVLDGIEVASRSAASGWGVCVGGVAGVAVAVGRWVRSSDADPSGPGND